MTFEQWLYEIENFSSRAERVYSELNPERLPCKDAKIKSWLKAAYDVGFSSGSLSQKWDK